MGCATSKRAPVCRKCKSPYAPITRSYSMHVHHPPQNEDDSYHLVALNSSTLGYLHLDQAYSFEPVRPRTPEKKESDEFAIGVIDAETWSKMIDEKIPKIAPKTPITTPPGEPETINAWELMEGLDDTSPLRPKNGANSHFRSFSFHVNPNKFMSPLDEPKNEVLEKNEKDRSTDSNSDSNSVFNSVFNSADTSVSSEFDTDVINEFRNSLELLHPADPFYIKPSADGCDDVLLDATDPKKLDNDFVIDCKNKSYNHSPPRVKEKLVLYFTSLRGVRKTYEDCCHVRDLLKATGVRVDERDVSMHSGFKDELKELLGGSIVGGLPKVFIGKKCIGGAMEIRRLHEDGHLEEALEGCEMLDSDGFGGGCGVGVGGCEACGDVRFVPCETCSGSCKIYYEDESDEVSDDEEDKEETDYGFQRCPDCNENGLIRCPICCD
ncbi:thioredoxin-like fold protein [Tanacetum coccineum]